MVLRLEEADLPEESRLTQYQIKLETFFTHTRPTPPTPPLRCTVRSIFAVQILSAQLGEGEDPPVCEQHRSLLQVSENCSPYSMVQWSEVIVICMVRLKLFLEQFSIKSCVLNSELPHNSRYCPLPSIFTCNMEAIVM